MKRYTGTDTILLSIIILFGSILRFYNYHLLPYSYDEFSALFRTRFDNFRDLIHYGVVTSDTHPAGIQVFMYYWVMVFGEGEEIVKLPFMLAGIGAIYLAYKIATTWFNSSVGLITAMFISFLQYPVTYSQFARPYASGLFFVLLFVWFFYNAFFIHSKKWKYYSIGYILAGAACAYNHHFSLFFLGLAGITGIFMVPWKRIGRLMISNVIIFLLYVPHLNIFIVQLSKGGVESWLRKPTLSFFMEYVSYLLHHSMMMYIAALALFFISLIYIKKTYRSANRYRVLMLSWVIITYATAYYYSIYRSSVLQYSVLIFTFPFLVMLVFSYTGKLKPLVKYILVIVFGSISIYTLVVDRQHYRIQYLTVHEQTLAETIAAMGKYGNEQVACVTNISPKIQDFYAAKYNLDPGRIITFDSAINCIDFRETLRSIPAEYLAISWVNIPDLKVFSVAMEVFPVVVDKKTYYTGEFYLLSKNRNVADTLLYDDRVRTIRIDSLSIYQNALAKGYPMLFDHNRLRMPGWLAYTTFFEGPLKEVADNSCNYLLISIEVENPEPDFESQMIFEVSRNGEIIYWVGREFSQFTKSDYGRYRIHLALKLIDLDFNYSDEHVKVYLSNVDEAYYYLNYFKMETTRGNPILYGLFQKIPE